MVHVSVLVAALTFAGGPTDASPQAQRRLAHQVDQALLYVDMKLPERARERLQELLATPLGSTDALTWLALARAFYAERRLDKAGQAIRRAQGFGITKRLPEKKWAHTFFHRFQETVGGLRIWADNCSRFRFSAGLAVPIVDRQRRSLLESVPGWRRKEFVRSTDAPFFLPEGTYKLGKARVRIIAGEDTSVTGEELEATCEVPIAPKAASIPTGMTGSAVGPTSAVSEAPGGIFSSPWFWVAIGAVVAAGGATAAVLATQGSSSGQQYRLTF